jgi:hypothetical protein
MARDDRVTEAGVLVDYLPTSQRRVTEVGVMVDYAIAPQRRFTQIMLIVEYGTADAAAVNAAAPSVSLT